MKPNNLYFKQIAENTTGETYSKLYSSNYYAKKIAEHYNTQYTGRNPLNKYLEDWYTGLTGETKPDSSKPNLWYLRRLAKATDDTINEKILNENQCLHIIADGEPTPPTPTSSAITLGITGNSFETYSTPFTYTGDVTIDWGDNTTETYTDGKLQHTYASTGDYVIKIYGEITGINGTGFVSSTTIKSVSLSDSITSIGTYAFVNCTYLSEVTLPNTITRLEQGTFTSCVELSSITIPNSVTYIGDQCFYGDSSLRDITLSNSLETLGTRVFENCNLLTSIDIPSSVTSIGDNCFSSANKLSDIILNWDSSNIIEYSQIQNSFNPSQAYFIPTGTTSLYEAKGYPSKRLIER